jgi:uncharacterized repeat protein (TIGR01451 family)
MTTTKVYIMICALCTASIAGNLLSAVVNAAQEPAVSIKMTVQNQTTNSAPSDADTKEAALAAKPGDILKYVMTVTNTAEEAEDAKNDFTSVKVISALPAGLELVSDSSVREITEQLGTLTPGKAATKEFMARVTSRGGDSVESKACFTGSYEKQSKPLSDCESAFAAIAAASTPPATPAPVETKPNPTPEPTPQQEQGKTATDTEALPTTGPADFIAPLAALGAGSLAYTGRFIALKRRG